MSLWHVGLNLKFDLPRYLLLEMSDQVVEAAESSRRCKQWRQIAVQDVPSDQSLRVTAQTWLKEEKILHRNLKNSSFEKKVVLIGLIYS